MRASAARNFREVVERLRVCAMLPFARDKFLAMPKEERDKKKHVAFFTAATFKNSPSNRDYSEAGSCNLIFLDIDPEKERKDGKWVETGKYPAMPYVKDPNCFFNLLSGFNFAVYSTASSTPEKPRIRVVVDAENIPLLAYPRAALAVAARLNLPTVTKESKVAVQPMFLPTMFQDSEDSDHPLIVHNLDGRAFTVADIGEELFPEFSEPQKVTEHGIDALDFLRAPVPEITLALAREALEHIDADCSRSEWLELAAALKHQFSPHRAEEAYEVFDEWSKTGCKYGGDDETRSLWDSLRPTPVGRMPVTIRSLLRQAAAGGWDDKAIKETCFTKLVAWMGEVTTITELLESGVHRIMATPLLSAVQEDILVDQLKTHAKKQFAYTISATAIKKDIARLKAEIRAQEKPAEKVKEPIWAKGVLYIAAPGDFYRRHTGEKYKSEAFNNIYSRHLLPSEDTLKEAGMPVTPENLAKPIVLPCHYALNHLKIVTAYDYAYDPSQPTEMFFVNRGRKYVNTYSPTYPEVDPKGAEAAGNLFYSHLENLVTEDAYRRTLVDFLATLVQSPGRKIRWAVLIQSVDGAGKTLIAEAAKAVLGAEHIRIVDTTTIHKGWNEWSFGSQLVVMEDVKVAGANRHEVMNTLKPLITNDEISINERNRNTRQAPNITNYLLFSNHHDALMLTPGDRRYFVIKSPLQHKAQVLALGENYFPPLYAMLRDKPGALRSWLANWEISPSFNPDGHAPRTSYVTDMVNDSASDLTASVRRLLLEGDYPLIQYDIVSTKALMDVLHMEEGINRATSQAIANVLREEGFEQIGRHLFGTERHYLWMRRGCGEAKPVDVAMERLRTGAKNLEMQMMF